MIKRNNVEIDNIIYNPCGDEYDIGENTQASVDLMAQVGQLLSSNNADQNPLTDITAIHDQKESGLCHSFATMSCFREVLKQTLRKTVMENYIKTPQQVKLLTDGLVQLTPITNETFERFRLNIAIADFIRTSPELLSQIIDEMDSYGIISFKSMLTTFVGSVNIRSLHENDKQGAKTHAVVLRLVYRTAFEIPGWKRLLPVQNIFSRLRLNIDEYKMTYQTVHHPNSECIEQVLLKFMPEKESWFQPSSSSFQV